MKKELIEEERNIRRLRFVVDFAMEYINKQNITHDRALKIVEGVKRYALKLFPDKEETFDIVYIPRFRRLLNAKYRRA